MISELLPLTEQKLRVLAFIYEKKETYLLEIAHKLHIHPYSLQKTLAKLKPFLELKRAGKTHLFCLDRKRDDYMNLISLIEEYRLKVLNPHLRLLIKRLQERFMYDNNILTCLIFGSVVRGAATSGSDIDVLFVAKKKYGIEKVCYELSVLFGKEIQPLLFTEKEFKIALKIREPAMISILEPSQRLIIIGKEFFLRAIANL